MWLKVAVAAPILQSLSYAFPRVSFLEPTKENVVGRRVLVNLSGRRVTGYVLDIESPVETDFKVKPVLEFLDSFPVFHSEMIPFFQWAADYYHYPVGLVIKAALPNGLTSRSAKKLTVIDKPGFIEKAEVLQIVDEPWVKELLVKAQVGTVKTAALLKDKAIKKTLVQLEKEKLVQVADVLVSDRVKAKYETCVQLSDACLQLLGENQPGLTCQEFDEKYSSVFTDLKLIERKTLFFINENSLQTGRGHILQASLNKRYSGARKALPLLLEKKLIEKIEKRVFRNPLGGEYVERKIPAKLSSEQAAVFAELKEYIGKKQFTTFLLHGVTGSGKTEVYLRAAQQALEKDKDVLVLVPEIALATQLESHFISRFKDKVVLQHSGLSAGEKYDQWFNALSGKAKIVIGARSAVFSPLKNLGLIIVDEEHDPAFKQDDSFRYNGRDLAVLRGKMCEAVVLLGSATPSVTTYYNSQNGKYRLLEMRKRVREQNLPEVQVVDIKTTVSHRKSKIFWPQLENALVENYANEQQSMVLLNRRGFSSVVICRECGTQVQCKNCNVSLTFHKGIGRLVCHYCGFNLPFETVCETCRSDKLVPVGFGTERVEEELKTILPTATIARLDSDSTRDKQKFLAVLKRMHAGEVDVMVGTQMIAKGHDFPGVTLVGVVYADSGLHTPDFRAGERTFQLISQVTGRAGRGDMPGKVIIQTMQPNHYAIKYAQSHQYEAFYDHELNIRTSPVYPPFVRLLAIHVDGINQNRVQQTALNIRKYLVQWGTSNRGETKKRYDILGPVPAPIEKLKGKYRAQLLIKGDDHELFGRIGRDVMLKSSELKADSSCAILLDVDPENMM